MDRQLEISTNQRSKKTSRQWNDRSRSVQPAACIGGDGTAGRAFTLICLKENSSTIAPVGYERIHLCWSLERLERASR